MTFRFISKIVQISLVIAWLLGSACDANAQAAATAPKSAGPAPPPGKPSTTPIRGSVTGPMPWSMTNRATVGLSFLKGSYSDTETNSGTGTTSEQSGVKLSGSRIQLMGIPGKSWELGLDYRQEKSDKTYWPWRRTAVATAGYILPWLKMIAPVIGIHWEFSRVITDQRDSPDLAKVDLRGLLLGLHVKQPLFRKDYSYSLFFLGNYHLVNPQGSASRGSELEAALGLGSNLFGFWADTSLGILRQTFNSTREATDEHPEQLDLNGSYQGMFWRFSLWI